MGKLSRNKGANAERAVANLLKEIFPEARRRPSGAECQLDQGRDIDGTPGYVFQVQCAAAPKPEKKLLEAIGASKNNNIPVALTRRSSRKESGEWMATLRMSDFLKLLRDKGLSTSGTPLSSNDREQTIPSGDVRGSL